MARGIRVEKLLFSQRTADKLQGKHGLSAFEVRAALEGVEGLRGKWETDPRRGSRALLHVFIRGERILVVLYPQPGPPSGVYALGAPTSTETFDL